MRRGWRVVAMLFAIVSRRGLPQTTMLKPS